MPHNLVIANHDEIMQGFMGLSPATQTRHDTPVPAVPEQANGIPFMTTEEGDTEFLGGSTVRQEEETPPDYHMDNDGDHAL